MDIVGESIKFILISIGIVYAFLLLMKLQAKIMNRYSRERNEEPVVSSTPSAPSVSASDSSSDLALVSDEEESSRIAAITAAIIDYENEESRRIAAVTAAIMDLHKNKKYKVS